MKEHLLDCMGIITEHFVYTWGNISNVKYMGK